jgi:hypothetical protein
VANQSAANLASFGSIASSFPWRAAWVRDLLTIDNILSFIAIIAVRPRRFESTTGATTSNSYEDSCSAHHV